jgi:hypothetical protein
MGVNAFGFSGKCGKITTETIEIMPKILTRPFWREGMHKYFFKGPIPYPFTSHPLPILSIPHPPLYPAAGSH